MHVRGKNERPRWVEEVGRVERRRLDGMSVDYDLHSDVIGTPITMTANMICASVGKLWRTIPDPWSTFMAHLCALYRCFLI